MLRALLVLLTWSGAARAGDAWQQRWARQVEARGLSPAEVTWPFALTDEMADFAREATRGCRAGRERLGCLQRALFDPPPFAYEIDTSLPADQAFAAWRGNCLSFTVLFITLARSLGEDARLVAVATAPAAWRDEDVVVVAEHVVAAVFEPDRVHLFDFQRGTDSWPRLRPLDDRVVSALFHSNLGSARLRAGDPEAARAELELAVRLAPEWTAGWVNLGVARRRSGDVAGAREAYRQALLREPHNAQALANLAWLHGAAGDADARQAALLAAARGRGATAYALVSLADVHLAQGQRWRARLLLWRASLLQPGLPEVRAARRRLARDRSAG